MKPGLRTCTLLGFLHLEITLPCKPPQQKIQRTRLTSSIRDQNEDRNSDSSDSDRESEDDLHYVMAPDTVHVTETWNREAETFYPHLGNEDVVDLLNLDTADQTDVTFTPSTERHECQNETMEPEISGAPKDRSPGQSTDMRDHPTTERIAPQTLI
ncbi:unnamed protein product [Caretta caretta]